jgi:hypothetical protein
MRKKHGKTPSDWNCTSNIGLADWFKGKSWKIGKSAGKADISWGKSMVSCRFS